MKKYFEDEVKNPGDKWIEYGPLNYIPPVEVEVLNMVKEIPLDCIEGIYVRDTKTGHVRAVIGETYMLKAHEELAEIQLASNVVELLNREQSQNLDLTRVVTYKIPYNTAVQVYDYSKKTSRVVFGPDLLMLNPDESVTVHSLSGGKPKKTKYVSIIIYRSWTRFHK